MLVDNYFSNKTIYIIDDEAEYLDVLEQMIHVHMDVKISTFVSANLALNKIKSGEMPNLIITDIKMPKLNGIDFLTMLRELKINKPALIISGHADKKEAVKSLKLNVSNLLEKPLSIEDLILEIKIALAKDELVLLSEKIQIEKDSLVKILHSIDKTMESEDEIFKIYNNISKLNISKDNLILQYRV